jgi:hypothetical protein
MNTNNNLPARDPQVDSYYSLLMSIQQEASTGDYKGMLADCERSLPLLDAFISETRKYSKGDEFKVKEIPAIERAAYYYAITDNLDGLERLAKIIDTAKELEQWQRTIKESKRVSTLATKIKKLAGVPEGVLQKELKRLLQNDNAEEIGRTAYYLVEYGILTKQKEGTTNRLRLA